MGGRPDGRRFIYYSLYLYHKKANLNLQDRRRERLGIACKLKPNNQTDCEDVSLNVQNNDSLCKKKRLSLGGMRGWMDGWWVDG